MSSSEAQRPAHRQTDRQVKWLSSEEWLQRYKAGIGPLQGAYLGFYSSIVDGFFQEPWGFWVPVDDHIVHRGDGVFEAMRLIDRAIFDLDSHLARLERSAAKISLNLPLSLSEIKKKCVELAKLCDVSEGVMRLYCSRGPGGFTQNPYEPKKSQLYLALTPWKDPAARWYEEGVKADVSRIEGKRPFEAGIKSCNYLQNVLQKKDTVDRGLDFTICLNEEGFVLEGSTESFYIITAENELLIPSTDMTLKGTTLTVVQRLADELVKKGKLRAAREARFHESEILKAKEVAFVGTTMGVVPVTRWKDRPVGDGKVGAIAKELGALLNQTMRGDPRVRTVF
jgi:4-amino-4-deoxychorismate lyase